MCGRLRATVNNVSLSTARRVLTGDSCTLMTLSRWSSGHLQQLKPNNHLGTFNVLACQPARRSNSRDNLNFTCAGARCSPYRFCLESWKTAHSLRFTAFSLDTAPNVVRLGFAASTPNISVFPQRFYHGSVLWSLEAHSVTISWTSAKPFIHNCTFDCYSQDRDSHFATSCAVDSELPRSSFTSTVEAE